MNLYVATFHHRTLPPVRWHIPASSFVAALAQAWALQSTVVGCTAVVVMPAD